MSGFRSISYEFAGTTEQLVDGLIAEVLNATYPDLNTALGLKTDLGKDKWIGYSDGYWSTFIRYDTSGITLQLTYHFPSTLCPNDGDTVMLNMIWERPGIKSKFFPKRSVYSLISLWQSAIEEKFRAAGLKYRQRDY